MSNYSGNCFYTSLHQKHMTNTFRNMEKFKYLFIYDIKCKKDKKGVDKKND